MEILSILQLDFFHGYLSYESGSDLQGIQSCLPLYSDFIGPANPPVDLTAPNLASLWGMEAPWWELLEINCIVWLVYSLGAHAFQHIDSIVWKKQPKMNLIQTSHLR